MAEVNARRLALTLDANEYARVRAYARQAGRPIATIAKRLLLGAMDRDDGNSAAAAASRDHERVRQLVDEVTRLQAQLDQYPAASDLQADLPRWRWRLDALLSDRQWWNEWLPSLGELLGRNLAQDRGYGEGQSQSIVDERGFADLMAYLFPDLTDDHGDAVLWHSPHYGRRARLAWEADHSTSALQQRPVRAEVWQPVVRHVALALTALETTSQAPNDAYTHLRVEAEIRGEWIRTLRTMLGDDGSELTQRLPRASLL